MNDVSVQGEVARTTANADAGEDEARISNPSVGILGADDQDALRLAQRVNELRPDASVHLLSLTEEGPSSFCATMDVLLVALGRSVANVAVAFSLLPDSPWLHIVFLCNSEPCPEGEAMRCLGAKYVVAEPEGWRWLEQAIVPLTRHARALRKLRTAQSMLPTIPLQDGSSGPTWLALPEAEQRFRESYLKAVLGRARTQREAAMLAGIPYTTLRSMIEKLLL